MDEADWADASDRSTRRQLFLARAKINNRFMDVEEG